MFDVHSEIRHVVCKNSLSNRAKGYLDRIQPEEVDTFEKMKNQLFKLYKITVLKFKEAFDSATKKGDESHKLFASRLTGLLDQYLKSKECDSFEKLFDLICADKLMGSLPPNAKEFIRLKSLDGPLELDELSHLVDCFMTDIEGCRSAHQS